MIDRGLGDVIGDEWRQGYWLEYQFCWEYLTPSITAVVIGRLHHTVRMVLQDVTDAIADCSEDLEFMRAASGVSQSRGARHGGD